MALQESGQFPKGVNFLYVPINMEEDALSCSRPIQLSLDKLVSQGNLLVVSVPGAFSPLCTEEHLPNILTNLDKLDKLNIKNVVIYSMNDAFVMSAWGKLLIEKYKIDANKVIFASDPNGQFSQANGLSTDRSKFGMSIRSERFAMIVDDFVVKYLKKDAAGVENSGIKGILAAKL